MAEVLLFHHAQGQTSGFHACGEVFLYPGDQHYFADSSLPGYDESATKLLTRRVLDFLEEHDSEAFSRS